MYESDKGQERNREEVYSKKIRAGKRTYFFDVKATKGNDYYLIITESKKKFEEGNYVKHKIFLYKEDFKKFSEGLLESLNYIQEELMPEYDFDAAPTSYHNNSSEEQEDEG
jgi:hypothetical protein